MSDVACVVLRLFSEENCLMRKSSFLDSSERKGVKGMSCDRVVMHPHVFTFVCLLFSACSTLDTEKLIKKCITTKWGNKSAVMSWNMPKSANSQVGWQRLVFVGWSSSQPGEISLLVRFFLHVFFLFAFQGIMRFWLSLGASPNAWGKGCSLPDLIGAAGESTAAEDLLLTVGATLIILSRFPIEKIG